MADAQAMNSRSMLFFLFSSRSKKNFNKEPKRAETNKQSTRDTLVFEILRLLGVFRVLGVLRVFRSIQRFGLCGSESCAHCRSSPPNARFESLFKLFPK